MSDNKNLDAALREVLSHVRDVSARDGVQSWDGNKWRIDDILTMIKALDGVSATMQKELGIKLLPIEMWGGGQVAQPAMFLHEDPLVNLNKIRKAAPHLDLQCLTRGRQCFGFIPVSDEVLEASLDVAIKGGIKVFRIFDMMNDPRNVAISIGILKERQRKNPEQGIVIEGALSYISEPEAGKRAWTLEEYADYAVKLAKMGADEIAIKNYAGVGAGEMVPLIEQIRAALSNADYKDMPVNLHMQCRAPQLLCDVLAAGADKVDVAIGDLSDGPSHTNMRDVINLLLKNKGFNQAEIDAHPVMQQLASVEAAIAEISHRKNIEKNTKEGVELKSFDDLRGPLKNLKPEDVERYRMAGGALSDLWGRVQEGFDSNYISWRTRGTRNIPGTPEALFTRILDKATGLWEKAGRFNTVTPGAKILIDQAIALTFKELFGKPITMQDYTLEYVNIATGRFGHNQGMEKGIGDVKWRDAMLMYRALNVFNEAVKKQEATIDQREMLSSLSAFGEARRRLYARKDGTFVLDGPEVEAVLMAEDKTKQKSTLERFKHAIEVAGLKDDLKKAMLAELSTGRSTTPTTGLEEGRAILEELKIFGIDVETLHTEGKPISNSQDMAVLAMMLRNRNAQGVDDGVIKKLLSHHAGIALSQPRAQAAAGKARA